MKKIVLIIMAVMAFAGMSVAQDVYYSGYYQTTYSGTSYEDAAVYKNGSRLYYASGNPVLGNHRSTDVNVYNGDVYWVWNCVDTDGTLMFGNIKKNSSNYLSTSGYSNIYGMYRFPSGNLWSVGAKNYDGVITAWRWRGDEADGYQMGNGTYESRAYAATGYDDNVYSCGYQYSNSSTYHGVIWKRNQVFYDFSSGTKLYGIAYYAGSFYTVGSSLESGEYKLKVWKTDAETGTTTVNNTLATMSSSYVDNRFKIYIDDAGDIYVNGMDGSTEKIWKNGTVLYTPTSSYLYDVHSNINGVYYVGNYGENGKVWKDNSVLYTPSNCKGATALFIEEPECTNTDVRALPFSEGFEKGNTSWPCWTTIDVDNNNNVANRSYWMRHGKNNVTPYTGDYCARHGANTSSSQEGWLITPRLFLQPGQDNTTLTFRSWVGESFYAKVYVSTDSDPTNTNNYQSVYNEQQTGNQWSLVTVDLSQYQGQAIYIGFKYVGTLGTSWLIDDVNVTESFQPCTNYSAPYSNDFSNGFGSCFTALDVDMSGGMKCWQPNTSGGYQSSGCLYHPYGQSGVAQTGWLYSIRLNLPSGNYNYTLTFKSKSTSSGTGRKNTAWIAVDKTGAYVPSDYTTKIWEDSDYSSSWTTYSVDLTSYKGHTVSIGFKYEGTFAHNWFIDDFAITQETAQYTITANSNNTNWGTVSGGGTYNSGATCTLVATPASGYQFESWKKNGSVVSTNATYSFTVTENATYTAYFSVVPVTYYTINTSVTPTGAGTVTGGGTYPEGASVTLTASNNNGYTFDHWQDGNTQNPRTITVTGNATYTATFTQDNYTITTGANPPAGGNVTGGGTFHYGETCTLTATPASNYEFAGWQDGNTDNPRSFTVTGNATYTATFNEVGSTYFTVTANVVPSGAGTVSGTGTYEAGSVIMLTANANQGYTFDHWNDGSTANPRSVTVNNDLSFTAYFTHNSYTITVNASPAGAGSVSGGGSYYYGDYATLSATAYTGYEFVGWSDGSSENPHQVLVTGNATYTATFSEVGTTYYTVSAYVSPNGAGTVSGTGTFPAGASTTLTATANSGYTFDHWNDGSTQNPRTVTVNNNMSFTAYFNTQEYTITTNVTPAGSGTVTGGGTYAYGASVMLMATPNTGFEFLQWSDGNMQNPRIITVTGNATYTALFSNGTGDVYTLTVTANYPLLGQVFGGGTYPAGSEVEISAYPNTYARFVKWSDGNTENPRTVVVNSDMEFVAEFVATQNYTITVESANPERGQAFGGDSYQEGSEVQIAAVAYTGYMFEKWQDGNTENPRTILVTGDATYTAYFVENSVVTYNVTLISNTDEGTVSGGGTYIAGTQATIQAFPNQGYVFTKWSDDNTDNPRTITVNSDITLVAFFATGVDENEQANMFVYPNPAKESIRIIGIEANSQIEIYNSLGELVKVMSVSADQEIGIRDLASGLYLIRCGKATMRFVKEQ